ncbi:MAG TPA: hypothetical protein VE869_10690 [Gemmatimonas sp.]|nr:hypothetical protein [Gemmatimonas sp.]
MIEPESSNTHARNNAPPTTEPAPRWVKIFGAVLVMLLLAFIVMHLVGGGFRGHGA